MILTVTMNPALDRLYRIAGFRVDHMHRLSEPAEVQATPGGKGINIALALERLGHTPIAMGLAGGHVGRNLVEQLQAHNLITNLIMGDIESRNNVFVFDPNTRSLTEISEAGTPPDIQDLELFYHAFDRMLQQSSMVILAGSLPAHTDSSVYGRLLELSASRKVPAVLHTTPRLMDAGGHRGPLLAICPDLRSHHELGGRRLETIADFVEAGKVLLAERPGSKVALLINRVEHVVAVSTEGTWLMRPRNLKVQNLLGYGDSLLAGFAFAIEAGQPLKEAIRFGCASGISSMEADAKFFESLTEVEANLERVEIEEVHP